MSESSSSVRQRFTGLSSDEEAESQAEVELPPEPEPEPVQEPAKVLAPGHGFNSERKTERG